MSECCEARSKHREEKEYKDLVNRLSRVEGQIRGIKNMVENDAYCIDILTQVSAAQAALSSFASKLLGSHINSCVVRDIRSGDDELSAATVDELLGIMKKLMK